LFYPTALQFQEIRVVVKEGRVIKRHAAATDSSRSRMLLIEVAIQRVTRCNTQQRGTLAARHPDQISKGLSRLEVQRLLRGWWSRPGMAASLGTVLRKNGLHISGKTHGRGRWWRDHGGSLPDTFVSHFDIDNCERLSHRIHHLN
jgi:hypothetical protein